MTAKQLKINSGLQFICFDYIKYTNSLTNEKGTPSIRINN